MAKHRITEYTVRSDKIGQPLDLAVVADLHNGSYEDVLPVLRKCDAILIVGDLVDRHDHGNGYDNAVRFLEDAPKCAPTFYSIGNHERMLRRRKDYWPHVTGSDVQVLDDQLVRFGGIVLGGLSSRSGGRHAKAGRFLRSMREAEGFKLLMCHHPEYYYPLVQGPGIDLTLAGHAHGGQVRLFGQGLFAPGQGLLPKLTSGWYDEKHLLVSRGMTNATWAPRLWNPCELIILHLRAEEEK